MIKHTLMAAIFLVSSGGFASAEPFTYAPDHCDMEVTFPEKPFIEKKCTSSGTKTECSDVVTFKKLAPPDTALNVRVTCVSHEKSVLDTYTPAVVEETLKRMTKDQNMEVYNIVSDLIDGLRGTTSTSIGTESDVSYIYTGQIWIGEKSLFTIEAKTTGENESIDKIFAEVLESTHAKGKKKEKAAAKPVKN